MSYVYNPLGWEEIRLLAIKPAGQWDSPLDCALIHVPLNSPRHSYEAISYTWGSKHGTKELRCDENGNVALVTQNCENAVRRFRLTDRIRLVWIDAVCINQEDIYERAAQVKIMRSIYGSASRALIYLGELYDSDEECRSDMEYSSDQDRKPENPRSLKALLSRRWFTRVWVLQEVASAKAASVVCGGITFSWDLLKSLADKSAGPPVLSYDEIPGSTSAALSVSRATRSCHSTDPRDKVFAILPNFTNYAKTCRQIYDEVARDVSASHSGLESLAACSGTSDIPKSMSWVPDWSQDYTNPCIHLGTRKHSAGGSCIPVRIPSSTSQFCTPISIHGVTLGIADFFGVPVNFGAPRLRKMKFKFYMGSVFDEKTYVACAEDLRSATADFDLRPNLFTSQGFIGVAPENTKYGDIICVLVGCPEPMILRKVLEDEKEHYIVVGSCWIAGVMQGEALVQFMEEIRNLYKSFKPEPEPEDLRMFTDFTLACDPEAWPITSAPSEEYEIW